jgi:hypothetical protein
MRWDTSDGSVRLVRNGKGRLALLSPEALRHVALEGFVKLQADMPRRGLSDFGMDLEQGERFLHSTPRLESCGSEAVSIGTSLPEIDVETFNYIGTCLSVLEC